VQDFDADVRSTTCRWFQFPDTPLNWGPGCTKSMANVSPGLVFDCEARPVDAAGEGTSVRVRGMRDNNLDPTWPPGSFVSISTDVPLDIDTVRTARVTCDWLPTALDNNNAVRYTAKVRVENVATTTIASNLVAGPASWVWLLPVLLPVLVLISLASVSGVPALLQDPARSLVPEAIWGRLSDMAYAGQRPLAITRLAQWQVALGLAAERPWLGWGAAAFSLIYPKRTGHWHGHPHNLPIDLAVSHGVPVAVLVGGVVLWLLVRALRRGMATGGLWDRAWWASALVLVTLHATDIPFYDSRINVAGWVLLAGLRVYR
jgi:hypothetical protein